MNEEKIVKMLIDDRNNSFNGKEINFVKKNYFDLLLKLFVLLFNSFGFNINNSRGNRIYKKLIFVDEVNNSNMSDNLKKTKKFFNEKHSKTLSMEFYKFKRKNHVRVGIILSFYLLIKLLLITLADIIISPFGKNEKFIVNSIVTVFDKYMSCDCFYNCSYFLMSDHHFFSSIIATRYEEASIVLQHGLILDKRFYYPIRAGKFFAWGNHSKSLMDNDPKVHVTGTLKFCLSDETRNKNTAFNNIIYCISTLDNSVVDYKIAALKKISSEKGFKLLVKCHPGSMFNISSIIEKYQNDDITFFKEEKIADIDFDVAISENSTINIDFLTMNKPFIIFDSNPGYFDCYKEIIPRCINESEVNEVLGNISKIDFDNIRKIVLKEELNNGEFQYYEEVL